MNYLFLRTMALAAVLLLLNDTPTKANTSWLNHVSKTGKYIGFKKDNGVQVYHIPDRILVFEFQGKNSITSFAFSHDENQIVVMDKAYTLYSYNIQSRKQIWKSDLSTFLEISPEGSMGQVSYTHDDNYIVVFDQSSYKSIGRTRWRFEAYALDAYSGEFMGYENEKKWEEIKEPIIIQRIVATPSGVYAFRSKEYFLDRFSIVVKGYNDLIFTNELMKERDYDIGISVDYALKKDGSLIPLSFWDEKLNSKYTLTYLDHQFNVKHKYARSKALNVKISHNQEQLISIINGKAEVYNFDINGDNKENGVKVRSFEISDGALQPLYWDKIHLVMGDIPNQIFKVYNPNDGKEISP